GSCGLDPTVGAVHSLKLTLTAPGMMTALGISPSGKLLVRYSVTVAIWFFGTSAPAATMRSTSSFQSAGVWPVPPVIIVIAWQVVQADSTSALPFPSGSGRACCLP